MKKINRKAIAFIPIIWAGAALATGIGYLITSAKPTPGPGSVESIISAIPIWGWIVGGLLIVVLIRS